MLCELLWWDWFCMMEDLLFFMRRVDDLQNLLQTSGWGHVCFDRSRWVIFFSLLYLVMMCVHVGARMYSHPQTGCRVKLQSSESPGQNKGSAVQSDLKSYLHPAFIAWITQPEEIKNVFVSVWAFSFPGVKELCIIYRHNFFLHCCFWEEERKKKRIGIKMWKRPCGYVILITQ